MIQQKIQYTRNILWKTSKNVSDFRHLIENMQSVEEPKNKNHKLKPLCSTFERPFQVCICCLKSIILNYNADICGLFMQICDIFKFQSIDII